MRRHMCLWQEQCLKVSEAIPVLLRALWELVANNKLFFTVMSHNEKDVSAAFDSTISWHPETKYSGNRQRSYSNCVQTATVIKCDQYCQRLDCWGWTEAAARLSSCITNARASGFIPLSHSRTQIASVSASSPVFSNDDISIKISNVSLAVFDFPASLSAMIIYIE